MQRGAPESLIPTTLSAQDPLIETSDCQHHEKDPFINHPTHPATTPKSPGTYPEIGKKCIL
eukprot:751960-Hanusia_phi.AAC.2